MFRAQEARTYQTNRLPSVVTTPPCVKRKCPGQVVIDAGWQDDSQEQIDTEIGGVDRLRLEFCHRIAQRF
jgi:hypothetical protein